MTFSQDPLSEVLDYHERTRHLLGRPARARAHLDWASEPEPFRSYPTAQMALLDLAPVPGDLLDARAQRQTMGLDGAWDPSNSPACAPPHLPLFLLEAGDLRALSMGLLGQQEIASDGAFAVAFLAELGPRLEAEGPWFYRAIHWEAGALGQVLYLEAEAAAMRGTGIGCFLDAEVHRVLGLWGTAWQCLYCFTVGRAIEDPRLTTLPAYPEREP
ncbi:MAG: hypothetical protein RBU30_00085 [Polyangia bacterium]|jgi:hypothetical protein|nr:hypothetical protein [Polyangia bacterium]